MLRKTFEIVLPSRKSVEAVITVSRYLSQRCRHGAKPFLADLQRPYPSLVFLHIVLMMRLSIPDYCHSSEHLPLLLRMFHKERSLNTYPNQALEIAIIMA